MARPGPPSRQAARPARLLLVPLLAASLGVVALPPAVAGAEPATYAPPVDGPVTQPWQLPVGPYAAGNRGIDFATTPGEAVRASAAGEVAFAGAVGGSHHVVLLHADGLRTSYSFLSDVSVSRGQQVAGGDVVGHAASSLHFGVRAGDRYLDPGELLAGGPPLVHLVALGDEALASEADERSRLLGALVAGGRLAFRAGAAGVAWARGGVVEAASGATSLVALAARTGFDALRVELEGLWIQANVLAVYAAQLGRLHLHLLALHRRAALFTGSQSRCTPRSAPVPAPPRHRRIAVLVAGFGSAGGDAAVLAVDTRALGYADADVAQLSYAGGRVPGVGDLRGVPTSEYEPAASTGDIGRGAEALRRLLEDVRAAHPGVPVDVIAHSQGGLVARAALGGESDRLDPRLPVVANLVTLGSPHDGTDLATAGALVGPTTIGGVLDVAAGSVSGGDVDLSSPAAAQLAETSRFVDELAERPLPSGTRVTSIAARGDLVVPALHSGLEGATNVVVPVDGVSAHTALPGAAATRREIALALAGRPPTCRGVLPDLWLAGGISIVEDGLGAAAGLGALWLDRLVPQTSIPVRTPALPLLARPGG